LIGQRDDAPNSSVPVSDLAVLRLLATAARNSHTAGLRADDAS
jgi:hypothetical protein